MVGRGVIHWLEVEAERTQGSSELVEELPVVPELSDLGARAHRLAESPEGELINDEASVRRLLGL